MRGGVQNIGQLKKGRGRAIEAFSVNLWTLTGSDGFAELASADGPADPRNARALHCRRRRGLRGIPGGPCDFRCQTALALLDDDVLGDTNLNRHILAAWADLGQLKAQLAQTRLAGYRMRIFPVHARWQDYLATPPPERPARPEALTTAEASGRYGLVISAVDRNVSRVAIAGARPEVVLGGSTNGLEAEIGRYRAGSIWQCLACSSPPEPHPSIEQAARQLAGMTSAKMAALAQEQELDLAAITDYLKHPECGTLGEREVRTIRRAHPPGLVSIVRVSRRWSPASGEGDHPFCQRRRAYGSRRRHPATLAGKRHHGAHRSPAQSRLPPLRHGRPTLTSDHASRKSLGPSYSPHVHGSARSTFYALASCLISVTPSEGNCASADMKPRRKQCLTRPALVTPDSSALSRI